MVQEALRKIGLTEEEIGIYLLLLLVCALKVKTPFRVINPVFTMHP